MDFSFTEEQEKLRQEIDNFCETEPYGEIDRRITLDFSPEFYRKVADKGWMGLAYPKEYGGQGYGKVEETIFHERMAFHDAPMCLDSYGTTAVLAGGILLKSGSEKQKRYYLPRITRGAMWIGQGFTEADAGSDLLSVKTSAVRHGNQYIINGEKMFQSWAHKSPYLIEHNMSQHAILLARTCRSAPPDKGLSLFIFDVTTPLLGMTVSPIQAMDGFTTNAVFFDNVRIPAESLIGEENRGWDYMIEGGVFYWDRRPGRFVGQMGRLLQQLIQYAKETQVEGQPLSENVLIRHKLAELAIGIEEMRLHSYRFASSFDKGLDIIEAITIMKLHSDQFQVHFSNVAMEILGPYGQLKEGAKYAPLKGIIEYMYRFLVLRSFSCTGPSAMKNVIAGCVLGLPNEFGIIF